jgi:hypothetical protein
VFSLFSLSVCLSVCRRDVVLWILFSIYSFEMKKKLLLKREEDDEEEEIKMIFGVVCT